MPNLETVILGLSCCTSDTIYGGHCPIGCPYAGRHIGSDECMDLLHQDALRLLELMRGNV